MVDLDPTSIPRFGRGRGGGIRHTPLSHALQSPIPIQIKDNKHISTFREFFTAKKERKQSRHKFSLSLSSLRNFPYIPPTKCSQNKFFVQQSTMPSPVANNLSQSTQSTLNKWIPVPTRPSSPSRQPHIHDPPSSPLESSKNPYEILSDDDDDNILTDMSPMTFLSDDSAPTNPRSSKKKKKKSSKKTLKKRRKSKSRGVLPSDSSMDSYDDIPLKRGSSTKMSSTQKQFLDDESIPSSNNGTIVTQSQTHPQPPDPSNDLFDSDLEKDDPKFKNSDIRSFCSKNSTPNSKKTPTTPIRELFLTSKTNDIEFSTYPPRALVDMLYTSKKFSSSIYLQHLQSLPYKDLRYQVMDYFTSLQQFDPSSQIPFSTQGYGFFDRFTLDWEISLLSHNDCITIILGIKDFNKSLVFCDFENLESMRDLLKITRDKLKSSSSKVHINLWTYSKKDPQLIDLTTEESTDIPINMHFTSNNKGGLLSAPTTSPADQLGINVNMMMANSISPSPLRPPTKNPSPSTPPAVPANQFSARFDIFPSNTTAINVPLVARQLFRIFKKADRTLRLLPWFRDDDNDVEAIDQEEDLPSSENQVKQWVDNPHIRNNRLYFAMRIECMAKPKHIRDTFVPWMLKNKSFIKLDELDAQEIYGIGFITELHPHLYNRSALKRFLIAKLNEQDTKVDINVYVRNVWNTHEKIKVIAKAVVIEVDKRYKDTAANALMNIDFSSFYRYAKFIPFDKTIIDDATLNNVLISNNTYQHATKRRILKGITSITDLHPTVDNSTSSIRDWLLSFDNQQPSPDQEFIFEHVETSVNGDLVLIYSSSYSDTVNHFLNHFEAHLRAKFRDPNSLYHSSTPFSTGSSSSHPNADYGRKIAALYSNNPQEAAPPVSPPKPKQLYYGAADSAPDTYLNHLMTPPPSKKNKPQNSTKPKTPPSPTPQPPPAYDTIILDRLSQLEKSTAKLSSSVDSRFNEFTKSKEQDKAAMISAVTTTVTQVLTTSLPQLIAAQLKVATTNSGGEQH